MDQKISASLFYQMAYESMHRLLSLPERPTAVFLVHDDFALGALRAVENHGLKVPDDISLLGFNDDPIAQHLSVPLTTMAQPFREIGRTAAEVLDSVISGREIPERRVRLNARLVVRASTAPIRK
jgi:DNA-binding LacI/PurR family transcriptional regulator